ncbi:hypothetical protein OG589_41670 [Sphaerisporangium sp. NBC_01403]|uniref:hypothetical protein n=1 Tax=Sphaerisporangium sp. NBC_01403 TaxID=2903599 RepID=UPI0032451C07
MSEGHPTAAQREALRLICAHEPMPAGRLAAELLAARRPSTNPGYGPAVARQASMLAWRLQAQGFIAEAADGVWRTTAGGRELIACPGATG